MCGIDSSDVWEPGRNTSIPMRIHSSRPASKHADLENTAPQAHKQGEPSCHTAGHNDVVRSSTSAGMSVGAKEDKSGGPSQSTVTLSSAADPPPGRHRQVPVVLRMPIPTIAVDDKPL
jgi:hypothetical protein